MSAKAEQFQTVNISPVIVGGLSDVNAHGETLLEKITAWVRSEMKKGKRMSDNLDHAKWSATVYNRIP